jgi:hypothetical protein
MLIGGEFSSIERLALRAPSPFRGRLVVPAGTSNRRLRSGTLVLSYSTTVRYVLRALVSRSSLLDSNRSSSL